MDNIFKKIDTILFEAAKEMAKPIIDENLGVLIYFATQFKINKKNKYKKKCLFLLNKLVARFNEHDFKSGLIDGFEGVFFTINYLEKCKIIKSSAEYLSELEDFLIESIHNDAETNYFDLYFGSIGKIQYYLNENRISEPKVMDTINKIIHSLWQNKKEYKGAIYWNDVSTNIDGVDLGFAHGILSVFQFLLKLKELNFNNELIAPLIEGIILTYKKAENKVIGTSFFPDLFSFTQKELIQINSRLAFCVGDLPIVYVFCYAGKVLKDDKLIAYSRKIMEVSTTQEVSSSHLRQYENYDFFDIGFCHGLSSITYLFYQINKYHNTDLMNFKTTYWKQELLRNMWKVIKIKEPIYEPVSFKFKDIAKIENEKYSFMSGLCGAALVLLAIENNETDWSSFLSIY